MNLTNFEIVISCLSVFVTIYIFWATPKYDLLRERYEKLVFPIFDYLEPYLFQQYCTEYVEHALCIFNSNKHLANAKLLQSAYYLKTSPCQKTYNNFCKYLIHQNDFLCLRLGLGLRNITYRINRNQYQTKFAFFLYVTLSTLVLLILEITTVISIISFAKLLLKAVLRV